MLVVCPQHKIVKLWLVEQPIARVNLTDFAKHIIISLSHPHGGGCRRGDMQENKSDIINRLKSARGHLDAVVRMVDEDAYCIDVIHQINAVQAALDKISVAVLDDHMHHCVVEAVRGENPDQRERVLGEIREVFAARGKL